MNLSLDDLNNVSFWTKHGNEKTKKIPFTIIYPSGRASITGCGHLGLISDALYVPEIIIQLNNICVSQSDYCLYIRSMLDIDYYDEVSKIRNQELIEDINNPTSIINSNLLLIATADINIVSLALLDETNSIENYGIGYKKPYDNCIISGGNGGRYTVMAYPNVGVLSLYNVPWSQNSRIAIFSGGALAPGTLAANLLLKKYIYGEKYGNNSFNSNIPVKIVSSSIKDYQCIKLIPTTECIPQHELRNITEQIKIHE